jgi:hypothetical protein
MDYPTSYSCNSSEVFRTVVDSSMSADVPNKNLSLVGKNK